MRVTDLDAQIPDQIGHAFGYYDYGEEIGMDSFFRSKDAVADYIAGYVRMAFAGGMLYGIREPGRGYIVGMVCVPEEFQGQGYMRSVMELAYAEGNRLKVPVILETDAKSKCDKYIHLGMHLEGIRDLGNYGKLYDLIKYPD